MRPETWGETLAAARERGPPARSRVSGLMFPRQVSGLRSQVRAPVPASPAAGPARTQVGELPWVEYARIHSPFFNESREVSPIRQNANR